MRHVDDKAKSLRLEKARKAKDEADKELAKKLAESQQKDKDLENAKIELLESGQRIERCGRCTSKSKRQVGSHTSFEPRKSQTGSRIEN